MTTVDSSVAYLGTTPPVSLSFPNNDEKRFNNEMVLFMTSRDDIYESVAGQSGRAKVIAKLSLILINWASDVGKAKCIPDAVCSIGGGILLKIFGSTRLGVHTPDADIDSLCIAPSFIDRVDFFSSFCDLMRKRHDVRMLSAIPDAYTPVLKFNIDDIAIDMIFVSLCTPSIPVQLDVLNSRCLRGIDDQGIRSLNGCRVAEWICRLVPNFPSFCTTLRFIKHWARQRGLYSNVLGFLGGINFAIMVAFVCQRYPNALPATLVKKFFLMFTQWRWPNPIMLTSIEELPLTETDGRHLPVWNPKLYPKDGCHLMPIITPAFPAMNSSYNVGLPQYRLIQDEIQRGHMIFQSNKSFSDPFPWGLLSTSAKKDFFLSAPRYIQVDIIASAPEDHKSWFGWCESRLRPLILSLEQPPMIFCHPQAKFFHRTIATVNSPTWNLTADNKSAPNRRTSIESPYLMKETAAAAAEGLVEDSDCPVHDQLIDCLGTDPSSESSTDDSHRTTFISSIFIGLSFCNLNLKSADLSPSIMDFMYKVNAYSRKKTTMSINVVLLTPEEIPSFVQNAEPTNCISAQISASCALCSALLDLTLSMFDVYTPDPSRCKPFYDHVDGDAVHNDVSAVQGTPLEGAPVTLLVKPQDLGPSIPISTPLNLSNGHVITQQYWFTEESVTPLVDPLLSINYSDSNSCSSSSAGIVAPDALIQPCKSSDIKSTWPRGVSIDQVMDISVPAIVSRSHHTLAVESNAKRKERTDSLLHQPSGNLSLQSISEFPLGPPPSLRNDICIPSTAAQDLSLQPPHQAATDTRATPSSPTKRIRKNSLL